MDRLWKIYARIVWRDWGRVSSFRTYGLEHPVIWIRSSRRIGGQYMLGGIYLNEERLEELSENVTDYVFVHEYGHSRSNKLFHLFSVAAQLVLIPLAVIGSFTLPIFWVIEMILIGFSPVLLPFTIAVSITLFLLILPLMVVRWIDEGYAELFAISKLGMTEYEAVKREIRENSKSSFPRLLIHFVLYPPDRLVKYIATR